jgi:two-component sensor histidine kinase
VGLVAFSPLLQQTANRAPLAFLAIVPLMWAALRLDQRNTATTAFILSCFAVWGTVSDGGPFARSNLNDSFLLLLTFLISISVPSLALSAEVAMRKRDIEHVNLVMRELSHRSKNLLSVVQGMAHQVARQSHSFDAFQSAFTTRLRAFAETHDLLVAGDWRGVDIRSLIRTHLAPFRDLDQHRDFLDGPGLSLTPKAAEQLGLAMHELATNAMKHGAFSVPAGAVKIRWEHVTEGPGKGELRISWKEVGGPAVKPPEVTGFGHLVVTQIVPMSLDGIASLDFEPDGLKWVLLIPSANFPSTRH